MTLRIEFYHIDAFEAVHYEPIWRALRQAGIDAQLVAVPGHENAASQGWFDFDRLKSYYDRRSIPFITHTDYQCAAITTQNEKILKSYAGAHIRLMYGPVVYPQAWGFTQKATQPFDAVLVHGPSYRDYFRRWKSGGELRVVGYPYYDDFFAGRIDAASVRSAWGIDPSRPTIVYLPTWDCNSSVDAFLETISALAGQYNVLVKPHHCTLRMEPQRMDRIRQSGLKVVDDAFALPTLFSIADLTLVDIRSAAFSESIMTDTPAVGLCSNPGDVTGWIEPSGIHRLAPVCTTETDLPSLVASALDKDEHQLVRRQWADRNVSYRDGTAAQHAADEIIRFIETRQQERMTSMPTISQKAEDRDPRKGKRNILWLMLDGLRPDKLFCCGNPDRPRLPLDDLLAGGTLFTRMFTAHNCSKTSMHAAFTSMYGATNGVNGYDIACLKNLDPNVLTLTDHLKRAGYSTFRYCDKSDPECNTTSKRGFDVWEHSGYRRLKDTPKYSFDVPQRDAFIDGYNRTAGPKFAYVHLLSLHDLAGDKGGLHWSSEMYEGFIESQSDDVASIMSKFKLGPDDLLVVSTDHGVDLDCNRRERTQAEGVRLYDHHMRIFCSFIAKGIPSQTAEKLVRIIDIAPTILDIIGAEPMGAQGASLLPVMEGKTLAPLEIFMARDSGYEDPPWTQSPCTWGVRTERWKYVMHRWRKECEWLMDLEKDPDYARNLIGAGLEVEAVLRRSVRETLIEHPKKPLELYAENKTAFSRRDIQPVISVILPVTKATARLKETVESLLDQVGPYFELVVVDGDETERTHLEIANAYGTHPHVHYHRLEGGGLHDLLNLGIQHIRGRYVALTWPDCVYEENFLYELKKQLDRHPEGGLAYSDYIAINQTGRTSVCRTAGEGEALQLDKRNDVGLCVLFHTRLLENTKRFTDEKHPCWSMWKQMVKETSFVNVPQVLARCYSIDERTMGQASPVSTSGPVPRVSVVLPTYNHLQFLPKAIESVLAQTYGDFELVVVNDGSTDGTREYLDGLQDPRIRVVHQENRRLPEALNTGFRAARGEMLTWISADNHCAPDFLQHLVGALEAYPEAGFAYSAFANVDGKGDIISIREGQSLVFHDILVGNPGVASFMYRRACQEKIGYYDPSVECAEDWDYWVRILEHFDPVYVPQVLYHYRRHDDTMSQRMAEEVCRASRKVFDKAMKRRNHTVDLDKLYPAIRLCRDKELARFHAGLDFGTRVLRSRFADPAVAVEVFEQMRRRETVRVHVTSNLAVAHARQGRWDQVLPLLKELTGQAEDPDVMRVCRAIINAQQTDDPQSLTDVTLFVVDRTQSELFQKEEQGLRVYQPQKHMDDIGSDERASWSEGTQSHRQARSSEEDPLEGTKASCDVNVSHQEGGHILASPRRLKIAVVANANLYAFMKEIIAHWQTLHDVQMLDCLDQKAIAENLMTADVMWFEWAAAGAVQATHMPRQCKTIVRLHSYEAFRDFPGEIKWSNVDDLVLVSPHIRNILSDRFPDIEKLTRVHVIPNCVDLDKFYFKDKPFGKRIAFVGALRPAKNIPLLLQCFREIHAADPEYSLHVAGELFGAPLHQGELFYYIKHALEEFGIKQSATFEGRVEDVSAWLDDKDFILSTSIREGHPVNVVEGMAKGLKPVVHNFPGAKSLYPSAWVFNTAAECRDMVLGAPLDRGQYRAYVQERWSSEVILPQLDALLDGAATGARHVACHPVVPEATQAPTAQAEQRLAAPSDGLTIFAVPKAFSGHIGTIQKNAVRSWARLDPAPEIILFGDEPGIEELAREVGARHEPHVGRNRLGTPLVNELFEAAQRLASNRVVAYVDADLIVFDDFIEAVQAVRKQFSTFLLVGRHRDFTLLDELDFLPGWQGELRREAIQEGMLHAEDSLSYLVFSRDLYQEIPPFAIGRTAWGNWMVRTARMNRVPVIDGTEAVVAVHQDHAYDHVAGGFTGARHGEEAECNRTLAGLMDDYAYTTGAAWVLDGERRLVQTELREPESNSTAFVVRRIQWLAKQARRLMAAEALDLAACRWEESLAVLDALLGPGQAESVRAAFSNSAEIGEGYKTVCVSLVQCYMRLDRPEQAAATYTRLLEASWVHLAEEQREQILRARDQLSHCKEQGLREHPAPSQTNRRPQSATDRDFTIFSFTNGRSTYEYSARSLADSWDRQAEIVVLRDMHFSDAVRECVERCDTPYFFKVDDDFILHPKAVAYMRKRVLEYPNPDELGIYYCHLWEDWTSRVRQSVKVYRAEALRHIGGFKADYLGMVDKATKAALERAGFKVVKDQSVIALHACGSWEEQLEYERLWSSVADKPYRKSTHNAMKEYCGTKSLDQQYAMRLEWLEDVNRQLNTPFHTFLLEHASTGSSHAGVLMPKVARTGEGSDAATRCEPCAPGTSAAISVDQPKVSIILACRNAEAHLPECLNSILTQSMPDWELLLLDDGSTDETRRIIEDYAGRCSRIIPFFFDDRAGPYVRRNFAIRRARAPFVTIQDADDIMCPDKLQRLHTAIAGDECLGIVGSFYRKFLDELTDIARTEPMLLATTHEEIMQQYSVESIWDYCWHGSAIVRRRLFDEIGLYDENPFGADSFWLGKAAAYAHHTGRIRLSNLSEFLTLRRLHGRSQTGVLPVIDPRSRRVRYRQYCEARLRQAVQKAQGEGTDLAHALRECTCEDFLQRFEAVIAESEKAPLDGRIVSHLLREIVGGLKNRRYVTCMHMLNGLETMDPAIAAQVPHFDLLRAIGFYGLGQREQCEVFLRREMANHENAIAEQFRQATFDGKVQIDVQQWCTAHADVLTFDRIDAVPAVSAPAESRIAEPDWQTQSLDLMEGRYRSMTTTDPAKHAMAVRLGELARRLRLPDKCKAFEHEAQTIKNKLQTLEPCRSTR